MGYRSEVKRKAVTRSLTAPLEGMTGLPHRTNSCAKGCSRQERRKLELLRSFDDKSQLIRRGIVWDKITAVRCSRLAKSGSNLRGPIACRSLGEADWAWEWSSHGTTFEQEPSY